MFGMIKKLFGDSDLLKTKESQENLKKELKKRILAELKEENCSKSEISNKINFIAEFKDWHDNIKDTEIYTNNILSRFIKIYCESIYENMKKDGAIAYLFEASLYKGYACAEYFINKKKYNNGIDIEYTNDIQSIASVLKLDELMEDNNDDEVFMNINIDNYFYNIVNEDNGSYEHLIVEEQRDAVVKNSKYYMLIGILYRFTELNMRYGDFPDETDVSMITKEEFPKLYDYIRK